jgi:hypothetical protein
VSLTLSLFFLTNLGPISIIFHDLPIGLQAQGQGHKKWCFVIISKSTEIRLSLQDAILISWLTLVLVRHVVFLHPWYSPGLFFSSILWCSHMGDHPQEELTKLVGTRDENSLKSPPWKHTWWSELYLFYFYVFFVFILYNKNKVFMWRWNISGQVRLISGSRFCHLEGCRIGLTETDNGSEWTGSDTHWQTKWINI